MDVKITNLGGFMESKELGFETNDAGNVEVESAGDSEKYYESVDFLPATGSRESRDEQGNLDIEFTIDEPTSSGYSEDSPSSTGSNPTEDEESLTEEAREGLEGEEAEAEGSSTPSTLPRVGSKPTSHRPKQEKYKGIEELKKNLKADLDRIKEFAQALQKKSQESQEGLQKIVNESGLNHNKATQYVISNIPDPQQPQIPPCPPRPPLIPPFVTRQNAALGNRVKLTYYFLKYAETNAPFEEPTFYDVANVIFTIADRYCADGNLITGMQELDTVNILARSALSPDQTDKKTAIKVASKTVMGKIKQQYESHVGEASATYGIPKEQIRAIIATESAGKSDATSGAAWGLMQITKSTWNGTRAKHPELANYYFDSFWKDPRVNIWFGTATLKDKMESIGVSTGDPNFAGLAVTAYNAGEGTVKKAISLAKQAGSVNPTADCLNAEYLKPAISYTGIYTFYFSGNGYKRNPHMKDKNVLKDGSTLEQATAAAIDLKYKEVSQYPKIVSAYLELQQ
jgi:hypothetical protein